MKKIERRTRLDLLDGTTLKVPVFTLEFIPSEYCAGYAKAVAKDLFNVDYGLGDAWELPYKYQFREIGNTGFSLRARSFRKGDLLGVYFTTSRNNIRSDSNGKPVKFTHMMVYLGIRKRDNQPVFAEQRIRDRMITSAREIENDSTLIPKCLIIPKLRKD
jgi:hypothetical protein